MRKTLFFLFCIITLPLYSALAQDTINRLPMQIVSFYSPEMLRILKESQETKKRCRGLLDVGLRSDCRKSLKKEKIWTMGVYEQPSLQAELKGKISIVISGKHGLEYRYLRDGAKKAIPFTTDITCAFMDSDCVAEHTVVDRQGDWVQIPADPVDGPGWIQFPQTFGVEPRIRAAIMEGRSYILGRSVSATKQKDGKDHLIVSGEGIFVKKVERGHIIVRRALPGDDICKPPKFELGQEPPEYAIHVAELYNGKGHLRIQPAYADYCKSSEEIGRDLKL